MIYYIIGKERSEKSRKEDMRCEVRRKMYNPGFSICLSPCR